MSNRSRSLVSTAASRMAAVAFDAGFNDLSTFNRRFSRVMGVSPSVYRKDRRSSHSPRA